MSFNNLVLDTQEKWVTKPTLAKFCKNCQLINEGKCSNFTMANLEEIHETELDIILGELNSMDQIICPNMLGEKYCNRSNTTSTTNSISTAGSNSPSIMSSEIFATTDAILQNHRTESPDNDSAFSDTLSLMSSESSASSSISSTNNIKQRILLEEDRVKVAKIQLALFKLEHATVKRLLIKAFTADGASKSILVDERMTCGQVTRMLADKNHVEMHSTWAIVENRNDLHIERFYEDHELLIDNIMLWDSNSKVRLLFLQLPEKSAFFETPEIFLPNSKKPASSQYDEVSRKYLLDEFFNVSSYLPLDGSLYLKNDIKKGWKKHHFTLKETGLYYFPKEKKSSRDAVCLVTFHDHCVYKGFGWKKKFKSPNDFTFALKSSEDQSLKMLCAEDYISLEKWIMAIRIAKHGKQIWHNYMNLVEDIKKNLQQKSNPLSTSYGSICKNTAVPSNSTSDNNSSISSSTGRVSRASSSSSSGCLSDDNGFDSEFTTGTIKRKPSMKPKLPLTTMTRQLKEVGEITICDSENSTLTRRQKKNKSSESNVNDSLQKCQYLLADDLSCFSGSPRTDSVSSSISRNFGSYDRCSQNLSECNSSIYGNKEELNICTSTLSLDSLPPPPPLTDLSLELYGSQTSISSLPLPPPPPPPSTEVSSFEYADKSYHECHSKEKVSPNEGYTYASEASSINNETLISNAAKPIAKNIHKRINPLNISRNTNTNMVSKTVSFADSAMIIKQSLPNETQLKSSVGHLNVKCKDMSPQSYDGKTNNSLDFESPKNLNESAASLSRDFLKDLQRVMRKKWQVAQKCKLEPATTPHEVLGFRDFPEEFCNQKNYYRETANVSNWVQEHYGSGANYAVYENFNSSNSVKLLSPSPSIVKKKRPPPPPPKRSESTQLTHRT